MEMPDLVAMARAAVLSERYDVQLDSRGDPRLAVHGGDLVCKFLHREGRAHVQESRAALMAQAPVLIELVRQLSKVVILRWSGLEQVDEDVEADLVSKAFAVMKRLGVVS